MTRFPDYQPSTALLQAIDALAEARRRQAVGLGQSAAEKKRREANAGPDRTTPLPGQEQGGPQHAELFTPGQEGADTGLAGGHREGSLGDKSGTDALMSGRSNAVGLGQSHKELPGLGQSRGKGEVEK